MRKLLLLLTVVGEHVPINRDAKIVLRCEDTTTAANDKGSLSACQWGCYRRCLGGRTAQSDAGVRAVDIMITGEDLSLCLDELPQNCRLHGSMFSYVLLDRFCAARPEVNKGESTEVAPVDVSVPAATQTGIHYKIAVPRSYSNMKLYTTTFSPTSVSLAFRGRVPPEVCLRESTYSTGVIKGTNYRDCSSLPDEKDMLSSEKAVLPYFSENRLDISLDSIASTLSASQRGFHVTDNVLLLHTNSNCFVQKPDDVFLFTKGNFTLTTGAAPWVLSALSISTCLYFFI